jgi:hypothetical protein
MQAHRISRKNMQLIMETAVERETMEMGAILQSARRYGLLTVRPYPRC